MIGERLRTLRKNKGITQKELADILGVRKAAVSLYETGKNDPTDPIKIILARYFNISVDYLIGIIDDEVSYYDNNIFLKLPENISDEEKRLINDVVELILFRRKQSKLDLTDK